MKNETLISDSREKVIAGVLKAAEVVTSTQGVGKRTVAISHENAMPFPSPDGAIIASNIKLGDREERIGSDWVLQAARRTAKEAGDGTTKTTAIAADILRKFPRRMPRRKLVSELEVASAFATGRVASMSVPVGSKDDLLHVATISANNDPSLGKLVSDLVWEVGEHGTIYVEDRSDEPEITSEVKKGYVLRPGLASEQFLRGLKGKSFHNPLVALIDEHVYDNKTLASVYKRFAQEYAQGGEYSRSLVIFCFKCDGDAVNSAVLSYFNGKPVAVVNVPGTYRSDVFSDLADISGAPVFSEHSGNPLTKLRGNGFGKEDVFGEVEKVTFDDGQVTVFGQAGEAHLESVMGREFDGEREKLRKERISKMKNGVGYIYIGGSSNAGMTNKGQLIDDAQEACFSALRHGYLPGGCWVELQVADSLDNIGTTGAKLLANALRSSFKNMLRNSDYPVSFGRWRLYSRDGMVFNMKTGDFEHAGTTKVLDATKAVECAIRNAVAVAVDVISIEKVITWTSS